MTVLWGIKEASAVGSVDCESSGINRGMEVKTAGLEYTQGWLNSWCSGEMRIDQEDDQWRRRLSGV